MNKKQTFFSHSPSVGRQIIMVLSDTCNKRKSRKRRKAGIMGDDLETGNFKRRKHIMGLIAEEATC